MTKKVVIKLSKVCVVCGKQTLKRLNKQEVFCKSCKSQYPVEWLHPQPKGK